ncbi:MAG TPA: hypothetical protein VF992_11720 [Thermoplasmata archaeon]
MNVAMRRVGNLRAPHRFNRWIFEGMFLGWGALTSLVLVAVLAVVTTVTSEPFAILLVLAVFTLVWWHLLWISFERGSGVR